MSIPFAELSIEQLRDEDPIRRKAVLTTRLEFRGHRGGNRNIEIHVLADDHRRMSTKLERASLDGLRCLRGQEPTDLRRAGEADLPHARLRHESRGDLTRITREHREDPTRNAALLRECGQR